MILNTGQRTDIPAFYSEWFYKRVQAGFVHVRNPYFPEQVTRFLISPDVVDAITFCTKNPTPMLPGLTQLNAFRTFWHITITGYGSDIEPHVPDYDDVIDSFIALSAHVSPARIGWRYDPIFLSERYSVEFHEEIFAHIAERLAGHTHQIVVSFIDLYQKTRRNFPQARQVQEADRLRLGRHFSKIGERLGMRVYSCFEGEQLASLGIDTTGCMTKGVLERAFGETLDIPPGLTRARPGCACLLSSDIGAYNSCGHLCRYCYANEDAALVQENMRKHNPDSPFLIGGPQPGDIIREAKQQRWANGQMILPILS